MGFVSQDITNFSEPLSCVCSYGCISMGAARVV